MLIRCGAVLALAALIFAARVEIAPRLVMSDFRAFYCGARAVLTHRDPYRTEPLRTCEREAGPLPAPAFLAQVAMPVPLPGYALGAFVPFAALPFGAACVAMLALICAAMLATIGMLARLGAGPPPLLAAAIAPLAMGASGLLGQLAPLVACALVAAALFARAGRWQLAAIVASAAMLEPHVGLAACLALALAATRTRLTFAVAALIALAATLAWTGTAGTAEYFRDVLPAHALANANEAHGLSLTAVLVQFNVAPRDAVRAGEIMYLAMLLCGIAVARRLYADDGDAAWLVLIPPAFAVFGGVHVHDTQTAVALPALLLLAARVPRARIAAAIGVALVMVPWFGVISPVLLPLVPLVVASYVYAAVPRPLAHALCVLAAVLAFGMIVAIAKVPPELSGVVVTTSAANALAERGWAEYVAHGLRDGGVLMLLMRAAIWSGLAIGLAACVSACVPRQVFARRQECVTHSFRSLGHPG